ncbi:MULTISPECIES: phage virion morphogenesis protein [unclassified Neptuniibacter]|uniref:phage virion morphogenesis protein n=1 Tax=unclassified Neptuniibacter TaxID=2630693 RepID=UPI0025FC2642|nr:MULTISPECIES: phage virion morphogenesis protein [unclassified Neptuniibacter]
MAGTHLTLGVDYNDQQIQHYLKKLHKLSNDMSPAMLEVSEFLHERSRDHFDDQEAPDGTPWATLTPETLARKRKKGVPVNQILHGEHLHLRDTIYPFHSTDVAGVSTGPGTTAYAATHQFGDEERNIEARPYFGLSAEDELEIIEIVKEHIDRKA